MATVKDFLLQHFGESANNIADIDHPALGGVEVKNPRFMCSSGGDLQVRCGGEVIIGFRRQDGIRGEIYLVRDDTAGRAWEYDRAGPRPLSVLRVVGTI